jgi:hypothetical protein
LQRLKDRRMVHRSSSPREEAMVAPSGAER